MVSGLRTGCERFGSVRDWKSEFYIERGGRDGYRVRVNIYG
jgi:hypothetical protein